MSDNEDVSAGFRDEPKFTITEPDESPAIGPDGSRLDDNGGQ